MLMLQFGAPYEVIDRLSGERRGSRPMGSILLLRSFASKKVDRPENETASFTVNGSLVDIETTGLPSDSCAEVVTIGFITGNSLRIVQRTRTDTSNQLLDRLPNLPRPLHAFNKEFEEYFLDRTIETEIQSRRFERRREAIQVAGLSDPFSGDGSKVVDAWNTYQKTREISHLKSIMEHNLSCLLTELCLLAVRKTVDSSP